MALTYAIWLSAFLFVAYGLGRLYAPLRRSRFFKVCFAPGFVALGGLRLLACSISGAEVKSVKFFAHDTDAVLYNQEDVTFLGKVMLATFPLIGALLVFAFVAWAFAWPAGYGRTPELPGESGTLAGYILEVGGAFVRSFASMVQASALALHEAGRGNLLPVLLLYLLISILLAAPPSRHELKYALAGIAVIGILLWLVTWAGIRFTGWTGRVHAFLWANFSFALALLIYVTVVTLAAIAIGNIIRTLASGPGRSANSRD